MIKTSAQEAYYKFAAEKDMSIADYAAGAIPTAGAVGGGAMGALGGYELGGTLGEILADKLKAQNTARTLRNARFGAGSSGRIIGTGLGLAGGTLLGGLTGKGVQGLVE